jgi:AcrR family transcriptional regulator
LINIVERVFYKINSMKTKDKIIKHAREIFANEGYKALGLREVAKRSHIATSVLYYYFTDKDSLLKVVFDNTNIELGMLRKKLPKAKNSSEMLKQRIAFQLDHSEMIITVLKYYLKYRKTFIKNQGGFVPEKAYFHILEVLERGVKAKEFSIDDVDSDAKVITHAINGFVMEYYPDIPKGKEKQKLINQIYGFIIKALKSK